MEYVYKLFFGTPDVTERPIPTAPWKLVVTKDLFPGNAAATPKFTHLENDPNVGNKILREIRVHRAFLLWAGIGNEGVDVNFLHGTQRLRDLKRPFPVIIELAKQESQRTTILGLTIWNTSVGTTLWEQGGWAINYKAKGPMDWEEYP